jgi:hypothetical protein
MARLVKQSDGSLKQVAKFDANLMLSPRDIFPSNQELAARYIVKKDKKQRGKPSKWYGVEDNSSLVRKIFRHCIKNIIDEVISGNCKFMMPGNSTASIYMGSLNKEDTIYSITHGESMRYFDHIATNKVIPVLKYKKSKNNRGTDLKIYVSKDKFTKIVGRANEGKKFSQRPRELDYFLPKLYEEFSYINEKKIKSIVVHCLRKMSSYLRKGEEMRFIDKEGEIRIYRPLGKYHDKVMKAVVKRRKTRELNKLKDGTDS